MTEDRGPRVEGRRIPSYDDLTPPIPNVLASETVPQLAVFLGALGAQGAVGAQGAPIAPNAPSAPNALYACLHADAHAAALLAIARDFSPRLMRMGERDVLLDVSGLGRLIGEPPRIAAALAREVGHAGVTARLAIAPTHTAARLLARGAPAAAASERSESSRSERGWGPASTEKCRPVVATGDPGTSLSPLPVVLLQTLEPLPPLITDRDRLRPYETLARWGIATLGDLAALPADAVASRLSRRGTILQRLARGEDLRPFVPDPDTPRYVERMELEWPIDGLEPLSFVLARLLDSLAASLERADRGAAAIRLDLRLTDRQTNRRVLQLPVAMRDPRVLRTLLLLNLEAAPPSAAIDIVTIEIDPAPARITQFSLLERALPSPEALSTLTARLDALVGESRVGSAVLLDSHAPDAFVMQRFALHDGATGAVGAAGARGAGASGTTGAGSAGAGAKDAQVAPAPVAPAPVALVALVAPVAPREAPVLRRQRTPAAIRVRVEHGRPVYVAAARRGMPHGAVVNAAGPWRTSGAWWVIEKDRRQKTEDGKKMEERAQESAHVPWSRDEWDVALSSGTVCRIYQDRVTERWHLDGLYD